MASDSSPSHLQPDPPPPLPDGQHGDKAPGLPPVLPPSSRHLVQMFVVPGLIVVGVVVLGLVCSGAFGFLFGFGQEHSAKAYIARLEDKNTDVRWRAANDLVQVLKRDDELASDPALGLKLAELLTQELDGIIDDEKQLAQRATKQSDVETKRGQSQVKARQDYARFLAACMANMTVPVGVDGLKRMATLSGNDVKAVAHTRRQAVWMLANLGVNLKRYLALPQARREKVQVEFEHEAANGPAARAALARLTLDYLQQTKDLGVIAALAQCADADDPDLRKYAAHALAIWEGSPAENALAEQALLKLSRDDGHGVRIILGDDD
ncbi:hypothetical protein AYO44_06240 [Planctomycetaceae bacterium SCGC AG-212-F19]|nr:hypothetical protein AYO44_06240 [Planctomycetaceae bacterium SCGC AG-212-F19]